MSDEHEHTAEIIDFPVIEEGPIDLTQPPTDVFEWIAFGVAKGWCSEPSCDAHDIVPMTEEESYIWEEGGDTCLHVVRLWDEARFTDADQLDAIAGHFARLATARRNEG